MKKDLISSKQQQHEEAATLQRVCGRMGSKGQTHCTVQRPGLSRGTDFESVKINGGPKTLSNCADSASARYVPTMALTRWAGVTSLASLETVRFLQLLTEIPNLPLQNSNLVM